MPKPRCSIIYLPERKGQSTEGHSEDSSSDRRSRPAGAEAPQVGQPPSRSRSHWTGIAVVPRLNSPDAAANFKNALYLNEIAWCSFCTFSITNSRWTIGCKTKGKDRALFSYEDETSVGAYAVPFTLVHVLCSLTRPDSESDRGRRHRLRAPDIPRGKG